MSQAESFCPYKGLQPYAEGDRPYFFGREQDRETIAANLVTAPLTILYGASGVGKTSVLQAGVAPFLEELSNVTVVIFRDWQDRAFIASLKAEVARAVSKQAGQSFSADDAPLDDFLARAAHAARGTLALILDQFEEYFLYHPPGELGHGFDAEFARAVNRPEIDANFLLSIREDSLSRLDRFQGRVPNLLDNYLRLDHLDCEAARSAIEEPIQVYNDLRATGGPAVVVEPELVDAVLEQVQTGQVVLAETGRGVVARRPAPDRARVETPYLQLVMTRLWDEAMAAGSQTLRLVTLERLGGAEQIVRTHLDAALGDLSPNEQDVAARVFHHLVTPGGTKIAHTASDLADYAELPGPRVDPVLELLSSAEMRILRLIPPPPGQPGASRYEIFHDVLGPAVLDWRARFVRAQERAEAKRQLAQEWRRVMRLRLGVIGLALLLVLLLVFVLIQWGPRIWTPRPRIDWAPVFAGEFLMGSDPEVYPEAKSDEMPQHPVTLNAYRIGRYEVTNAEYAQCVRATVCQEPADPTRYQDPEYADHPVVYVSWFDAQTFCEWMGGRLPTEAEWEYAARGPEGHIYPWGNEPPTCERARFWLCSERDTLPVGSLPEGASWCGAHDLAGNVWEWVTDWYGDYPSTPQTNPTGSERGYTRVLRGGSWLNYPLGVRSANRSWYHPVNCHKSIGFRCVFASTSSP